MTYVSLHTHSQYSILDSTISVKDLAKKAAEEGMPAVGISDFGNMYGAVDFFKACQKEGVKPIIGIELMIAPESMHDKKRIQGKANGYSILLYAKNEIGYQNLCILSSKASLEGFYYFPRIDTELLSQHAEGLVCLTGGVNGYLGAAILQGDYEKELSLLQELFPGDLYLEIQRHAMQEAHIDQDGIRSEVWLLHKYEEYIEAQTKLNEHLLQIAKEKNLPLIATNDVHYLSRDDWNAHEILLNIQSGEPCEIWERDSFGNPKARVLNPKRKVYSSHELYFKSAQEMEALFSDLPEAISATAEVAEKCTFSFDFKKKYYPVFYPPALDGQQNVDEETRHKAAVAYLKQLCEEGIPDRYSKERLEKVAEKYPGQDPIQVVRERLEYELEIIISKSLCDYLLIVHDFIFWAKGQGIPVGPGRGSGAGSIILYLIGITDIEPLRFNLFFERFINPERLSYPDIDVDICMERRGEVIDYTLKKYGRDKVAQIITFGTMKAKMAIKDVGRVLSVPLAKVNEIAKLVPEDPTMTLDRALELDPDLRALCEEDEEVKRVVDLAQKVEGSIRNTGVHAAGLIICGDSLTDHIPVCNAKDSDIVTTQYSMKPVEAVGMLKIDFLGLKTLTSIQKAADAVTRKTKQPLDWVNLPLDDKPTFDLLNQGNTLGVFQLESGGMQELAKNLHIDKFEEIIAVGALYRPGPMEMIPSFINRKHGREEIEIDHPLMKEIIQETYGIMVYQEQVMQISQTLAQYSLGEGDVLRRAMGKKDREEMARQREKFLSGSVANGISEDVALTIFNKIEKFASYGFNKSHAAAYGFLSYVTAFFKANYPGEWMASLMTCDIDDLSKVSKHIRECQAMDIAILPPDVNESGGEFVATSEGVRFALSGIKGVGHGVVEAIIEEREVSGLFTSFQDFLTRIDVKRVGKKSIENMIDAGCFDFTKLSRKALQMQLPMLFESTVRQQKEEAKGFLDMFSDVELSPPPRAEVEQTEEEYTKKERLTKEKELLGFYLTGHPMDEYGDTISELKCVPLSQVSASKHGTLLKVACIVEVSSVKISAKSGKKFAIVILSDGIERYEVPIWPGVYETNPRLFDENSIVYMIVQVEEDGGDKKLRCRFASDLEEVDEEKRAEFEAAFAAAKEAVERDKKRAKKPSKVVMPTQKLRLNMDVDSARLHHILQLKQIFTESAGNTPIDLCFYKAGQKVGVVEIGSEWGVKTDQKLKDTLLTLSFISQASIEEI